MAGLVGGTKVIQTSLRDEQREWLCVQGIESIWATYWIPWNGFKNSVPRKMGENMIKVPSDNKMEFVFGTWLRPSFIVTTCSACSILLIVCTAHFKALILGSYHFIVLSSKNCRIPSTHRYSWVLVKILESITFLWASVKWGGGLELCHRLVCIETHRTWD